MDLLHTTLKGLKSALDSKEVSSVELTQAYLDRVAALEPTVQAFVTVSPETALKTAAAWDEKRAKGENLPAFAGIPMAIKDLMVTNDMQTTCSSKILEGFVAPYDGTAVKRIRDAGFVVFGKLNMDEFAMGSSTETSYYKKTVNPWDVNRVPGGSSGGTAAAVAARLTPASFGSDTGGSIRQPASFCGIVGLKPTYGLVSRYGLIAFASSLDQIGPMTLNVEDAADLLTVVAGHDPLDSTSANVPPQDYGKALTGNVKGLRIGLPKEYFGEGIDPKVREAVDKALDVYRQLGCEFVDISMPCATGNAIATYYILATAEASSNLARFDGVRYGYRADADGLFDMYAKTRSEGFGTEVKRRIMLGTYVLSAGYYDAYYLKAQKVRTLIKRDFLKAFEQCDIIAGPTCPGAAFRFGEKSADPVEMYLNDIYTVSLNIFGGCGVSVPCGFDGNGMPVGLQLLGNYFDEARLLNASYAYQQATDWIKQAPELAKK